MVDPLAPKIAQPATNCKTFFWVEIRIWTCINNTL